MAIKYLPEIAEDDYPAFRRLPSNNFPNTYYEWLDLANKHFKETVGSGFTAIQVQVKAGEFSAFCREIRSGYYLHNLYNFAAKKAGQQHD